ncbi:hypothetical protein KBZ18_08765 [Synechococcus sp. Cruz-9H2]|uniref:hypothetical protein n=1 Tax=unclassified Synechococcus TaxID=2626047 RepID=UPI0020CFA260|nr:MULTISPECIES: hypothetical protein [unclassified Synechococcus]MCP9819583.1 hypothetical protein [Synechococcus sp. Cruz-9H2]MCP9843887.1 hypothetical protein [Synechococcus sp. Edmonson 11F2]MCP9855755.1 hypothetical protein [Synechococcus sp. Cruz-9C9]MCP9863297.1 hypothetical protein [Synechococcus sp. Cruz-7E5]MCP9870390.1 hypothetical protein [Synechococcus sp. Cruz-7B9]
MKDPAGQRMLRWLCALLLVGGAAWMAPHGQLSDWNVLQAFWGAAAVMGLGFALSWWIVALPVVWFWGVAIASRLLLLAMEPGDDVWRYLWEGTIQQHGFNPYELPPDASALQALRPAWWGQINHPGVTAIYPPLTQLGFRLLTLVPAKVLLFKLAFLASDLGICALLSRRFGAVAALLWAWNPLVIYSFSGGAHYDSWFLLPLVGAWFLLDPATGPDSGPAPSTTQGPGTAGRWAWASLLIGVSVAIKWVSLLLLAYPCWRALRSGRTLLALGLVLLGLMPLGLGSLAFCESLGCPLIPTGSAFVAHARSSEFVPHLLARIWPATTSSNAIHLLPLAVVVALLLWRCRRFGGFAQAYWFALLMLSPIVHLWYFSWIVPFAVPTANWGVRLVSLSGFIYFVLLHRHPHWNLLEIERGLIWVPFVVGFAITQLRPSRCQRPDLSIPSVP